MRPSDENLSVSDQELHLRATVIDLHADTLQRVLDEGADLAERSGSGHLDIPRMREGGLDAQFFSVWVNPNIYRGEQQMERAFRLIDALKSQIARHSQHLELATSAEDIERIVAQGRIACLIGIEGGHTLNGKIDNLRRLFDAGARYMTITWSNTNELGDSSGDRSIHNGLSALGKEVVRQMNRLGMMIDVSHVSDKTFYDVLETTTRPVIASHSCARSLASHRRNITDDMLRAMARNGGAVFVNFYSAFLDDQFNRNQAVAFQQIQPEMAKLEREFRGDPVRKYIERDKLRAAALERLPQVPFQRIVDHIEHIIKVAGVDHVGLGSDFDGVPSLPSGMKSAAELPNITKEMRRRGYSDADIMKVLGGNLLRIFAAQKQ